MDVSNFAKYSIKTNSVPQSFSVSADLQEKISMNIEGYKFEMELNVSQTLFLPRFVHWEAFHILTQ